MIKIIFSDMDGSNVTLHPISAIKSRKFLSVRRA